MNNDHIIITINDEDANEWIKQQQKASKRMKLIKRAIISFIVIFAFFATSQFINLSQTRKIQMNRPAQDNSGTPGQHQETSLVTAVTSLASKGVLVAKQSVNLLTLPGRVVADTMPSPTPSGCNTITEITHNGFKWRRVGAKKHNFDFLINQYTDIERRGDTQLVVGGLILECEDTAVRNGYYRNLTDIKRGIPTDWDKFKQPVNIFIALVIFRAYFVIMNLFLK